MAGARAARGEHIVLIIDDDVSFGEMALGALQSMAFAARFHRGPFGSLRAIRESDYCTILLDVNMPIVDAALLLRMIRAGFDGNRVDVLLCSGMQEDTLRRLAKELGVRGVIPKSYFVDRMMSEIASIIRDAPR